MTAFTRRYVSAVVSVLALFYGVFAVSAPVSAADVAVRAVVDRNVIDPSETVNLSVIITGQGGEVDLSAIKDFRILSRGSSTSLQIVNMKMTKESRYTYGLMPLREGTLTIPPLTVTAGNTRVTTEPITITVRPGGAEARGNSGAPGRLPSPGGTREAFVSAKVSNSSPWVGQPVTYTFTFARRVQIADARFEKPSFEGFSAGEEADEKNYRKVIGGLEYEVTELRYRLLPLRPGKRTIEPAVLIAKVPDARRPRSRLGFPFDDPFFSFGRTSWRSRTFRSGPVDLNVRELPPQPKGGYSGLMGRFSISASLEPADVGVGDSATLTLTVTGKGNVEEAPAPEVGTPDWIRVYPDQPEAGGDGKKIFRFALVPSAPGSVSLGPFRLTYFDPQAGAYKTASTARVTLTARGAVEEVTKEPVPAPATPADGAEGRGRARVPEGVQSFISRVVTPLGAVILVALVLGAVILRKAFPVLRRMFAGRDRSRVRIREEARTALRTARDVCGNDPGAWADAVYTAILLAARLKTGSAVPPSPDELGRIFHGDDHEAARRIVELMEAVEGARFAGFGSDAGERKRITDEVERLVSRAG